YGSQTGNARRLAEELAKRAEVAGLAVRLLRADDYPLRELKDERLLYVVISTQGDGDPPEDSLGFIEHLSGRRAPTLKQLSYAVLGLGDSSYPQFCAVARRLDERLAELGGARLLARGEADVDIAPVAAPWLDRALDEAGKQLRREPQAATVTPLRRAATTQGAAFGRDRPFAAELLVNQRITGRGSDRDVRHVELSLEGSGLSYQPGDALGIWPENAPALVERVLETLRLDGDAIVTVAGRETRLAQALGQQRELTRLSRPFAVAHGERAGAAPLAELAGDSAALRAWFESHQAIDLFEQWPADWSAQELVDALPGLSPRLYSIASSPAEYGSDVHLTVAVVRDVSNGGTRWGAASGQGARLDEGAALKVFIEPNERFRLPADASSDVIMIGPGTGIAPFRAFVQQRGAEGGSGRNWLVFGARRFRQDFLYQIEWQRALKQGRLHRLDLAFSRDGAERIYV
ncbi:MAG: assimilatory sulfite reductase (NADPH) flavoprotein subunit, partial [Gammaproteobacteria bacterium HGW-Gammaproteobacteria-7]